MNAIERLKRDHGIVRTKLDVLEAALKMGPETWFVLREVCFTLSRQLRDHIRREEALIEACRPSLDSASLSRLSAEHQDEPRHLKTINRLFVQEPTAALERIRPVLMGVIQGLRRHIEEEDMSLFPAIERVLGASGAADPASVPLFQLDETMTVNHIIQEFPFTKPVFAELLINVPIEGCTCLDEVAWRHGLTSEELLAKLHEAVLVAEPLAERAGGGPNALARNQLTAMEETR